MKIAFCFLLLATATFSPALRADIQAPPAAEDSATRKLGRGVANLFTGFTEIPVCIAEENERDGNAAAVAYGFIRGVGRGFARTGSGFFDIVSFPMPTNRGRYIPMLRPDVPWIYSGYTEFPPELGWESRYSYARIDGRY